MLQFRELFNTAVKYPENHSRQRQKIFGIIVLELIVYFPGIRIE